MYCNDNSSYTTIEGLLNSAETGLPPVYGCTDSDVKIMIVTLTVNDGAVIILLTILRL